LALIVVDFDRELITQHKTLKDAWPIFLKVEHGFIIKGDVVATTGGDS
jgi:hypothetical protein